MRKRELSKLFLLLSSGVILAACGTETEEAPTETDTPDTEDVEESEEAAPTETDETAGEITASFDILIDGESVADLSQEVTVPEGTYLLDAMHDTYNIEDEDTFITTIEGYEQDADAGRYWLYYINGEFPTVGAADYELEEADEIEWRLEDSE